MEVRTLLGVPECGLCFGAGMIWEGHGVTLVSSSFDPKARLQNAVAAVRAESKAQAAAAAPAYEAAAASAVRSFDGSLVNLLMPLCGRSTR
jgi:hypothetical protein